MRDASNSAVLYSSSPTRVSPVSNMNTVRSNFDVPVCTATGETRTLSNSRFSTRGVRQFNITWTSGS
jgi:hypothetical protein